MNGPATARWARSDARTRAHLVVILIAWPLITMVATAVALMSLPYYSVPVERAVQAALVGVALLSVDLLAAGLVWFGVSRWLFRRLGRAPEPGAIGRLRLGAEPMLFCAAVTWGTALWYPALLGQPLLAIVAGLPAVVAMGLLGAAIVAGGLWVANSGRRLRLFTALLIVGMLAPLPLHGRAWTTGLGGTPPTLAIVGLDSLSQSDPIGPLRDWTATHGGTWYERAVAPGLLTNAVWASILTGQPVREHGVFHAFQSLPAGPMPFLDAARGAGYRTVAFFPDQLTSAPGAQADFDESWSGPVGWRQILLPIVANSSVLVPLVRPVLPAWWPSPLAVNQAGTFTYDLRRDVRAILRSGRRDQQTLVAAHLTYVHLQAYPRSIDMTWAELRRVAAATAGTIRDRGFDWQDRDRPGDPIALRHWKVARLQSVVAEEVGRSGLLAAGGALVVFSDHGDRVGLTAETFVEPRYHHVVLATFGLPSRCSSDPISLIDVGRLARLGTVRGEPDVEFVLAPPAIWPSLVGTASLDWSGRVDLDSSLLDRIFSDLRRHEPWPAPARSCVE